MAVERSRCTGAHRAPLAVAAGLAVALLGCHRRAVDFGPEGEPRSADEVLRRVAVAEVSVASVHGDGRLSIASDRGSGAFGAFVSALHPAFLHLEQLDFFGRPAGVLATDGAVFALHEIAAGRFYRGPATAATIGAFLPLALPPAELVALLLGRVPRIPADEASLAWDDAARAFVVTLRRGAARQVLVVAPPHYRVVRSTVQGVAAYDVELDDVKLEGAVAFPRRLVLTSGGQRAVRVELRWHGVQVNGPVDLGLFALEVPEGAVAAELDADGRERPLDDAARGAAGASADAGAPDGGSR